MENKKTHLEILTDHADNILKQNNALMTTSELSAEFKEFSARLAEIDNVSKTIKVNDDDTLAVAENTYSDIQGLLKTLDNKRIIVGAEYLNTTRLINGFANKIKEILETAKKRVNTEISSYKIVQRAAAQKELEAKQKEIDRIEGEKKAEAERLAKIQLMITSKTFGGLWTKKDGVRIEEQGCKTVVQCDRLIELLNDHFPDISEFSHFPDNAEQLKQKLFGQINTLKSKIIEGDKIDNLKKKAFLQTRQDEIEREKAVEKQIKNEVKDASAEAKEAGKGLREYLKFNVHDTGLVPREFMSVDERKINDYITVHKDSIKAGLKQNKQPINGVTFHVEVKHVSS